jgi:MFS family permease
MYITGALALGFFVCYGTIKIQSSYSWRIPFIIAMIVALIVAIGTPLLPYSPRWLVTKGRKDEAEMVLDLITEPENQDERKELLAVPPAGPKAGWIDIFAKGVRGRTFLGAFLNVSRHGTLLSLSLHKLIGSLSAGFSTAFGCVVPPTFTSFVS